MSEERSKPEIKPLELPPVEELFVCLVEVYEIILLTGCSIEEAVRILDERDGS
jgi:hypothetical protein